ncbi:MAG: hypothetical protein HYR51_14360 [Candidatus Rokubacteria bacterium]|nr:hypothetical protein [Candidatus Rokubacteria bacterium]
MNAVERVLEGDLVALLDRLAGSVPQGTVPSVVGANPTLRARLDEVDARLGELRAALLSDYGRWRRALEDVENLWALASWRSAAQEPVDQAATLAA